MKKLLQKELRLTIHPTNILFLFLSVMVLIPNYPYYVIFFYTGLGIFFTCLNGRENHDITYSLLLPVQKKDVVSARFLFVVLFEGLQAAAVVPVIIIKEHLPVAPNVVGMEANAALVGLVLLMLGVFNLLFFEVYYRNPDKVGKSFLMGTAGMGICMIASETLVHTVPVFRDCIDTMGTAYLSYKLVVLFIGAVGYGLLTLTAWKRAQWRFERIDQ